MRYLFYLLGFYLLLLFIQYLTVFLRIKKSTLQYTQFFLVPPKEVPQHFKTTLSIAIAQLKALGFQQEQYIQTEPVFKMWSATNWSVVLINPEKNTCATVDINFFSESVSLFKFNFYSFLTDDTVLVTMNGEKHGFLGDMPQFIVEDSYAVDLFSQWQTHQAKLEQLINGERQAQILKLPDFLELITVHSRQYLDYLARQKTIIPQGNNQFKLSLTTLIKITHGVIQGTKKVNQMLVKRRELAKSNPNLSPAILPEIEVEAFNRMEQMNAGLVSKQFRVWLLFISLVIFALITSLGQWFDSWNLIIFVSAIAFHELGHALAMKLFGYQDTSILFIPFFGALATGKKENATMTQKFWVSLAGPLPGLILGIIFAFASQGESLNWLYDVSIIFISLNIFNLLPIYPLDGGQIAEILMFSGFPYLGVMFKILGVIILSLLAILIQRPLLLFLAFLIAYGIPQSFRTTKINIRIRSQLKQKQNCARQDILLAIFQSFNTFDNLKSPFGKRYGLAKNLWLRQQENTARWTTKIFLSFIYAIALLGGIIMSLVAMLPGGIANARYLVETQEQTTQRIISERQQIIDRTTGEISNNPQNIEAYLARAKAQPLDVASQLADYDRIVDLAPNNLEYRKARARLRNTMGDYRGAIEDYDRILITNDRDTEAYYSKAFALVNLQQYQAAIEIYNRILVSDPQNVTALYSRANIFDTVKQYQQALDDYSQIIQLEPDNSWAYISRGEIQLKLENYQAALDNSNAAIALDSEEPTAYSLRSQAKQHLGDLVGSKKDRQRATDLEL